MNLSTIKNSKLNEHYFTITNELNVPILLYPTPHFSSVCASFATNFGSTTTFFKQKNSNDFTEIVDGTAHYLEHKLFQDQGEQNTFNLFAATGAKANARTSRNTTAYYFFCTHNFEQSLKILLNFVQHPDFNEKSILKERGIISQEIQMLEDDPAERMFNNCMEALYKFHPAGKKIGGSINSIEKINADLLQKCYDAFYNLKNMAILIAGNFNLNSTLNTIEQNLKIPTYQPEIELKKIEEPCEVVNSHIECNMAIMVPYFCIGYKIKPPTDDKLILKQKLIFEIVCEMLTGEGSNLQNKLYEQKLVSGGILSYSIEAGNGYFAVLFAGVSTNYKKVYELLNAEIECVQKNGFDQALFNLVKKAAFGEQISNFNSVKSLAELMLDCFDSTNLNIFSCIETISTLNLEELNENFKLLKTKHSVLSVCLPKEVK